MKKMNYIKPVCLFLMFNAFIFGQGGTKIPRPRDKNVKWTENQYL